MGARYAKGDRAWGICQRCGQRDRLYALVFDEHYPLLRVHRECFDIRHPQERLLPVLDPVALWRARSVPRWVPVVAAISAVATLVLPPDGPAGLVAECASSASTTALGWYAYRTA